MSNINGLFGAEPEDYFIPRYRKTEILVMLTTGFPASWNNLYGI